MRIEKNAYSIQNNEVNKGRKKNEKRTKWQTKTRALKRWKCRKWKVKLKGKGEKINLFNKNDNDKFIQNEVLGWSINK